mmetsp:Transcript_13549/g.31828  ORF Transcript_13549/g.31828 Transcript_13549/m.31828 type:complete len:653 (-) Transcript_13549:154-2112(-)
MIYRAAILLSLIASTRVEAFAPHAPASPVSRMETPRRSFASSSWMLAVSETDSSPYSEVATGESTSDSVEGDAVAVEDNLQDDVVLPDEEKVPKPDYDFALLFDCDGVILETEELHRLAYNAAFREFEVTRVCGDVLEPVKWSVGYYDILQNSIGGGKPKMRHYFSQLLRFESNEKGDPTKITANLQTQKQKRKARRKKSNAGSAINAVTLAAADIATGLESLIDAIQTRKTELYKTTVEDTAVPRPGLLDLMDEALADDSIAVGVCSASTKEAAQKVLECTLGPDRVGKLDVCILGDDVSEKKPSPLIYDTARSRLGIDTADRCVVVEDSAVGLRAAKAAGMRCLITYTTSTTNEDFYGMGADAKVPDLINRGKPVTLGSIFDPMREAFSSSNEDFTVVPELLVGLKDDPVAEDEEEELYDDDDNLIAAPLASSDGDADEVEASDPPPSEAGTEESSPEEAKSPPSAEAEADDESPDDDEEVTEAAEESDEVDEVTVSAESESTSLSAEEDSDEEEAQEGEGKSEEPSPVTEEPFGEFSTPSSSSIDEEKEDETPTEEVPSPAEEPVVAATEEASSTMDDLPDAVPEPEETTTTEEDPPAAAADAAATASEPPAEEEEAAPVAPPPPQPQPRRILRKKAKMVQDDMGNFSM